MGYIRGAYANAACDLIDELKARGIVARVGYLSATRKRQRTLIVVTDADPAQIPAEFQGFRVTVQTSAAGGDGGHKREAADA